MEMGLIKISKIKMVISKKKMSQPYQFSSTEVKVKTKDLDSKITYMLATVMDLEINQLMREWIKVVIANLLMIKI